MMNIKRACSEETCPINQTNYTKYLRKLSSGSQNHKVLKYIIEHGSITSMDAFEHLRITRLSARIRDIKDTGCPIKSETVVRKDGTHYSRYF